MQNQGSQSLFTVPKPQSSQASALSQAFLLPSVFGGLAGLFMEGFLHPIDTVRVRIKANTKDVIPLFTQVKNMQRYEGSLSYFRGFTCTLSGGFVTNASYFYFYEKLKHVLSQKEALSKDTAPFIAAFVGGVLSDILALPFEVVRTRMQLEPGSYDYKHFWDGAKKVLQREGFSKLYLGGPAFFALSAIETSLTFGFYEMFYKSLGVYFKTSSETNLPLSMISSISAAAIAGFITNPLDVLVMRLQSQNTELHSSLSGAAMARQIYKNEGYRGFLKGVAGTMSYCSMGALILFPTYEILKGFTQVDLSK